MHSYKIGFFNLRNCYFTTNKNFEIIASMIKSEKLDIIAFQEVHSEGKGLNRLRMYLPGWEYSADDNKFASDDYAFLWNARRLELVKRNNKDVLPTSNINLHSKLVSKISRPPLYGRFQPINGGFFEFRFIDIHIFHGGSDILSNVEKRKEEYKILIDVIHQGVSNKGSGDSKIPYTISMGDYNLTLNQIYEDQKTKSHIITIQKEATTLKSPDTEELISDYYSKNYDHFSYDENHFYKNGLVHNCYRVDAINKYYNGNNKKYYKEISDHVPIVMEIQI